MQFRCKVYFQRFSIDWVWQTGRPMVAFLVPQIFLYTGVTSANFRSEGKVVEFMGMFIKCNKKGENKSTFSFKVFAVMPNTLDALLLSSLFNSSSSVVALKDKRFLQNFKTILLL